MRQAVVALGRGVVRLPDNPSRFFSHQVRARKWARHLASHGTGKHVHTWFPSLLNCQVEVSQGWSLLWSLLNKLRRYSSDRSCKAPALQALRPRDTNIHSRGMYLGFVARIRCAAAAVPPSAVRALRKPELQRAFNTKFEQQTCSCLEL